MTLCEHKGSKRAAAEGRKLLDISPVTKSFTEYTADPRVIEAHRLAVGRYLSGSSRFGR